MSRAAPVRDSHDRITDDLVAALRPLRFRPPVAYVYAPLEYARAPYDLYLRRFGAGPKEVVFLGMNPGPFGMAQTGVPFGEVGLVRGWLGIEAKVARPAREHPKRPVLGFGCQRAEVSGARLWGFARETFREPASFFERFLVLNYCPLAFLEESGRNLTPDKLPANERARLFEACDEALRRSVALLSPRLVIGVGAFALRRATEALACSGIALGTILHPSPASPLANRDWAGTVRRQLGALGVELPPRRAR